MTLLETRELGKTFKQAEQAVNALSDINLRINEHDFVVITGESGSGKTTLLSLLSGLDRPTQGSILFDGEALQTAASRKLAELRREHMGIIFQDFRLIRHLSARDNIRLPMLFSGRYDGFEAALSIVEKCHLTHRLNHRPDELSRGEMQRIAVARALVNQPKVLLADEPTANLDKRNGEIIWKILTDLSRNDGVTIVVATHDLTYAGDANRVLRLDDGILAS